MFARARSGTTSNATFKTSVALRARRERARDR
jgi:hypothetical protein